jgi:histidine triad (HIT) family protein
MPTVFTRIIEGEIPGEFVWRDDRAVAFMSINPITRGHALVVPIAEVDHWLDLDEDLTQHLTAIAQRVGQAQQAAFHPTRIGLMVAGFEVPHTHLHVLPISGLGDLSFANAATHVDFDDLAAAAQAIRDNLGG